MPSLDHQTWLRCAVPHPAPRQRLICFPHVGGSAAFFRGWGSHLTHAEVFGVCYPGRAERIGEPPPTDLRQLAQEIAAAVEPLSERPLVLFGHSMGSVVAFETARVLEARGISPAHLIVSGSRDMSGRDASRLEQGVDLSELDAETAIRQLVALGGTDPEIAADPLFAELVLPYVLSDFRMLKAYQLAPEPVVHCPVTAVVGDRDPEPELRPWSRLTAAGFRQEVVPGDHFYLAANPPYALLRDITWR